MNTDSCHMHNLRQSRRSATDGIKVKAWLQASSALMGHLALLQVKDVRRVEVTRECHARAASIAAVAIGRHRQQACERGGHGEGEDILLHLEESPDLEASSLL